MKRPNYLATAHLEFLDDLRESGAVNMFGASSYLRTEFPLLTREQAKKIWVYWAETFGQKKR